MCNKQLEHKGRNKDSRLEELGRCQRHLKDKGRFEREMARVNVRKTPCTCCENLEERGVRNAAEMQEHVALASGESSSGIWAEARWC